MGVNLIPKPTIEARQRARVTRAWVRGGAVLMVLLVAGCVVAQLLWGNAPQDLAQKQQLLSRGISDAQRRLDQLNAELIAAQKRVEANRAVTNQPDWSVLLALMSQTLDDRVMLSGCWFEAMRLDDGKQMYAASSWPQRKDGFPVHVSGYGMDLQSVSAYILRLEATDLFDEVRLVSTRSEPLPTTSRHAIAFELSCFLKLAGGAGGSGGEGGGSDG